MYGVCPKCLVTDFDGSGTMRERRPNGFTQCGSCGVKSKSREWAEEDRLTNSVLRKMLSERDGIIRSLKREIERMQNA